MKKSVQIVLIVVITVAAVWGIYFFTNKQSIPPQTASETSVSNVTPTPAMTRYRNSEVGLSLFHPSNYSVKHFTQNDQNSVLLVSFFPNKEKERAIILSVYPAKNSQTLEDWINTYTTSLTQAKNQQYFLYQVSNIRYDTVNNQKVAIFTIGDPKVGTSEATLFLSGQYVIFLTHPTGKEIDVYQKMLASLTF